MIQWLRRKWRIAKLCKEHARSLGFLREYQIARAHGCSPVEALEEWDLLTEDIIMKIQAEYNSLIDIELPPPPTNGCFTLNIDALGLTIRIRERERTPAAPPRSRPAAGFQRFLIEPAKAAETLSRLHAIIDGKNAKTCALAIIAAEKAGIITHPSYSALRDEFPEISRRNNYNYFFSRPDNYEKDVESIRIALS